MSFVFILKDLMKNWFYLILSFLTKDMLYQKISFYEANWGTKPYIILVNVTKKLQCSTFYQLYHTKTQH